MTDIKADLEDFRNFVFLAHKFIGLESPTPLQFQMSDNLQASSSREAIQAFRGCGKSHLAALYSLWTLYHHPDAKILVSSANRMYLKNDDAAGRSFIYKRKKRGPRMSYTLEWKSHRGD